MKNFIRYTIMAFASVGIVAGAVQATADEAPAHLQAVNAISVSYADLNLESAAGRDTLQKRIDRAAEKVCGPQSTRLAGSLSRAVKGQACYQQARLDAMTAVERGLQSL
jgi:UrcA family protein